MNTVFVDLVLRSGSHDAIEALQDTQKKQITLGPHAYARLIARAPHSEQPAMRLRMLTETDVDFYAYEKLCMPHLGFLDARAIAATAEWRKAKAENKLAKGDGESADYGLILIALALGILASQSAAEWVVSELSNPAYPPNHPVFDVLHFNAALKGLVTP
jgi:hypothetical protein